MKREGCAHPSLHDRVRSFSECEGSMPHAGGRSQCGQCRREDGYDDLNDGLPSVFLHGIRLFG